MSRVCLCDLPAIYLRYPSLLFAAKADSYSNTVCSLIGVSKAFRPLSTSSRRIFLLCSGDFVGSPSGYGIPIAGTILFAPIVLEIGTTVQTCTTGIPTRSISFTIVAPQRVQVPQVEVRITAPIPSSFSFPTKSSPNAFALPVAVPVPVVVIK